MSNSKSLSPFLAILLNLILPGFGYLYLGQVRRALTVLGLFYLIIGFTTFYLGLSFIGFVIAVILIVGLYAYVLIDSFQRTRGGQALRFHPIQRKRILVPLLGFFLFVNSFFSEHKKIQSYIVPSVSMCPGVHTGDRLFVEKNAPYVSGKVYVHALPSDPSVVFIKRLIGLPGDKISIRNGDLFINEKSVIVSKQPVGNQLKDGCSQRLLGELADISKTEAMIYEASIDDQRISFLFLGSSMNDFKEIVVPSGQYFFIGDNLNFSYDSRTYGLVEAHDIKGKALYSYFSSHAGQVFWSRIGHKY